MDELLTTIEWVPVLVSTIIAFALGWLWYSPKMFYQKWQDGLPQPPKWRAPMWMPMFAQLGSTLFLAVIVNMSMQDGHVAHAVLVTLTIMGFIKASGMYSGKTRGAIMVETLYILVMLIIMILVNNVL